MTKLVSGWSYRWRGNRGFVASGLKVAGLSVLVGGCSPVGVGDLESDGVDEPVAQDVAPLWTDVASYWCTLGSDGAGCVREDGTPTNRAPVVSACWEPGTFGDATLANQRLWVEDTFRRNYARYGRVSFVNPSGATNWGQCSTGQDGIHFYIDVAAEQGGTCGGSNTGTGTDMDGLTNGQRMPSCLPNICGRAANAPVEPCVRHIALHELGHDVGFFHENEKPDTPPVCYQNTAPVGQAYGEYDCNVNYGAPIGNTCSAMFSTRDGCPDPVGEALTVLSPGNIAALHRAYGRRRFALVDTFGRCAHVPFGGAGSTVTNSDCEVSGGELGNTKFRYRASDRGLFAYNFPGLYRLGTTSSSAGATVKITSSVNAGSKWNFTSVNIRGWGGLCLTLIGGNTSGGRVHLWYCGADSGANQKWTITAGKEIRFGDGSTAKCLTRPTAASTDTQLYVTNCGSTRQIFDFDLDTDDSKVSQIVAHSYGDCLDAAGPLDSEYLAGIGLPTNGQPVVAYTCLPKQFNQKWFITGSLKNDYGFCLDRDNDNNGTLFRQRACDGSNSQIFDLNF
jgi:hypothetical protein